MPFCLVTGQFVPEKSNIWRDCVDGYYDWVKEHLEDGAPLNEPDHCGDPPLLLAAGGGHLTCVKLLIEEGADLDQRNVMGESPLIRAAHNGHLHCVQFLLDEGCDINAVDMGDNTALHWAAMRGHVEIVKLLCDRGCDKVNADHFKQAGQNCHRPLPASLVKCMEVHARGPECLLGVMP